MTELPPRERDIAMVFQDYALYPHMTLLDNIGYPLKVRGVPKAEMTARVTEVAHELQIGDLLARRPGQVSGGQQQRASVARALVHQARVFLFDEPLSNLDAKLRLEARAFLKHLQQEVGVTAVYVDPRPGRSDGTRRSCCGDECGRVMQLGNPLEVYRRPANTFVAAFIGSPPMNLLPCQVDINAGKIIFEQERTLDISGYRQRWGEVIKNERNVTLGIRPENITAQPDRGARLDPQPGVCDSAARWGMVGSDSGGRQLVSVRLFQDEEPELSGKDHLAEIRSRSYLSLR